MDNSSSKNRRGAPLRILLLVMVGALGVGGLYAYRESTRSDPEAEKAARTLALGLLEQRQQADPYREYIKGIFDQYHAEAARAAYVSEGFPKPYEFDENRYLLELGKRLGAQAAADNKKGASECLPPIFYDNRGSASGNGGGPLRRDAH